MCLYTHDYTIRAQSYYFFLDYAIEAPLFTKIYVYRLAGAGKREGRFFGLNMRVLDNYQFGSSEGTGGVRKEASASREWFEKDSRRSRLCYGNVTIMFR